MTCSSTSLAPDDILCYTCRDSLDSLLASVATNESFFGFTHNYWSVYQCSMLSCRICLVIWNAIQQEKVVARVKDQQIIDATLNDLYFAAWKNNFQETFVISFRFGPPSTFSRRRQDNHSQLRADFHLQPVNGKQNILDILAMQLLAVPATSIEDNVLHFEPLRGISTGSKGTLGKISTWTNTCLQTHSACPEWRKLIATGNGFPT